MSILKPDDRFTYSKLHKKDTIKYFTSGIKLFEKEVDVILWAAMIGYSENKRESFDDGISAAEGVRWHYFNEHCQTLAMLVVATEDSFDILKVKNKDIKKNFIKNIEEHVNHGLNQMLLKKEEYADNNYLVKTLLKRL